ncbi:unnamed protein product [Rotaria sordida]|uniref:Uncharacterized protein n=1 Tax=Rotaria sordida TaxID=392033 RepID=A0A815NW26_9BILA|nr:unnamed protein product [Rotaria sordida]
MKILALIRAKKRYSYITICPIPIFFRINLQAILNIPDLKWKDTNRCKELEFPIENRLDLRLLPNDTITLVFQDSDVDASLEFILST